MRNESIYRKTAEDLLMLLLVTCFLGVASLVMADWPYADMTIHSPAPEHIRSADMLDALNTLFVKPFSMYIRDITPRLHLASLSFHF